MDRGRKWIAVGDGSRPERHCGRRWMTGDGSCAEMDCSTICITTGYGWMTGGGWQEMDDRGQMTINLFLYMKLRSYNRARICRHTVFQRHGSTEYDAKHYSALFRALFRDTESCIYMPKVQCLIRARIRSRVTARMPIPRIMKP